MHIFCDLDGVLVDFEGGFLRNHGFAHNSVPEGVMWKYIMEHERHWHELPMMHDGQVLWDFIKDRNPTILTGCPRSGFSHADIGKRYWVEEMLAPKPPVITCRSKDKQLHMIAPGDVLIDDMKKNIDRWIAAGGIGILHTSAESSIAQLEKLLQTHDELV